MKITDFEEDKKESYDKSCPKCGGETYLSRSGQHIKWSCVNCGYIKFLAQSIELFNMPIGKYKGKSLKEINEIDPGYMQWASENMENKIGIKIKEYLNKKDSQNG